MFAHAFIGGSSLEQQSRQQALGQRALEARLGCLDKFAHSTECFMVSFKVHVDLDERRSVTLHTKKTTLWRQNP